MTQLLIQGSTILAQGPFTDTGSVLLTSDQVIPKSVIPGYVIVDVALPVGFSVAKYQYVGGALQRIPDTAQQIADAKTARIAQVEALAKSKRDFIVAGISPAEMSSWPIKRTEAINFNASVTTATPNGDPTVAPNLSTEATARGITLQALVTKVLAKAAYLANLEAQISGNAGKHDDAINALASVDAINAYDFSAGWPL